jgi:short-subunit dehydrogenase
MNQEPFYQNAVIVTGASSGIGRHLALQLAEKGAWLTLAARSTAELGRVAELCRDRGAKAIAVTTDVSNDSQCKALIERSLEEYGRIDTLINNAGIGMRARFEELPDLSVMEMIMRANFWGSVYCTHYALECLKATQGRLVAVISGGGRFPTPYSCGYGASKHAMAGFFDTLRVELAASGISVTAIYPDWVATGVSARACGADGKPVGETVTQEQGAMSPEVCAGLILKAAAKRERTVMSTRQKLGLVLAPIFPKLIDKIAVRAWMGDDYRP